MSQFSKSISIDNNMEYITKWLKGLLRKSSLDLKKVVGY